MFVLSRSISIFFIMIIFKTKTLRFKSCLMNLLRAFIILFYTIHIVTLSLILFLLKFVLFNLNLSSSFVPGVLTINFRLLGTQLVSSASSGGQVFATYSPHSMVLSITSFQASCQHVFFYSLFPSLLQSASL